MDFEKYRVYEFLRGAFSDNTHEKCAKVHKGIPMVYFGIYMYQQYVYGVVV